MVENTERLSEQGASDFSAERFLRKTVVFAYGFFLLFLFRNDAIRYLVDGKYQPITVAGALILIAVSVSYASRTAPRGGAHSAGGTRRTLLCLFLLAPIVWSFAAPVEVRELSDTEHHHKITFAGKSEHDPEALSRPGPRDITLKFPAADGSGKVESLVYTPINLLELGILLEGETGDYDGARVAVRGRVASGGGTDDFLLTRFTSGWCVVHAAEHAEALSMLVSSPDAGKFKRDEWVTVYGTIQEQPHGVRDKPGREQRYFILAEKIEPVSEPDEPIMIKWSGGKPFYF